MTRWLAAVWMVFALVLGGCTSAPMTSEEIASASAAMSRDWNLTPGDFCTTSDPDFDGYRYEESIAHCRRDVSRSTKVSVAADYGVSEDELADYQIDHFIPLSIGGSNSRRNLWPLPYADARRKARLEQQLYNQISRGEITQGEAVDMMLSWQ